MQAAGFPADAYTSLSVHLFGPFECRVQHEPLRSLRTRKGQWALALLLLRGGAEVNRNWLAGVLWPESPDCQALSSLRRCLTDLRQALGDVSVTLRSPSQNTLMLDLRLVEADVLQFDAAIARGDRPSLERAVALYRGPLLEGCTEEWVWQERQTREQAFLGALERLARAAMEEGDPGAAVRYLRRAVAVDSFRESAHRELMAALSAAGDYAAATVVYRDLRTRLYEELNSQPSPETVALFEQIRRDARARAQATGEVTAPTAREARPTREAAPVLARPAPGMEPGVSSDVRTGGLGSPASPPPSHLPRPLTELLGRADEVAQIKERLSRTRLLTLTGAGGLGKTRLAIQVAGEVLLDFPDGAWFVDLAAVSSEANVPQTLATVLGLHEEPQRPILETLVGHLQQRRLLVILDNCEHLISACAHLAHRLLAECPEIRVLATSRETLSISGETVWRVPVLALPDEGQDGDHALHSAAVRLFVERAATARPGFVVDERNVSLVVELCRRLDGIALAIELAAARLKVLTLEQVVARLNDRFQLLTGGSRTALPRQQTLRATLDWSYGLLSEPERRLLRRLAVFAGAWSLEAAERVCPDADASAVPGTADEIGPESILELLTQLVEKSLVWVEEYHGEIRYRLFESTRAYCRALIAESEEESRFRARHAEYVLGTVQAARARLDGPDMGNVILHLDGVHEEVRAALDWLGREQATAQEWETALTLACQIWRFWYIRGFLSEANRRFAALLQRPTASSSNRAIALGAVALLALDRGDLAVAREQAEVCRREFARLDDPAGVIWPTNLLGKIAQAAGRAGEAEECYREVLRLAEELDHDSGRAMAWNNLGVLALEQERFTDSRAFHEKCLALDRRRENPGGIAWSLANIANISLKQRDPQSARECYRQCLQIFRELRHPRGITVSLAGLAEAERLGDPGVHGAARAARLHGAVEANLRTLGIAPGTTTPREERAVGELRAQLGEIGFAQEWAQGRLMSLEEAITFALAAPRSGRVSLGPFARA